MTFSLLWPLVIAVGSKRKVLLVVADAGQVEKRNKTEQWEKHIFTVVFLEIADIYAPVDV